MVIRSKSARSSLTMLPSSPREAVRHPDVENRVILVGDDVDPKVVVAAHVPNLEARDSSTSLGMTKGIMIDNIKNVTAGIGGRSLATEAQKSAQQTNKLKHKS